MNKIITKKKSGFSLIELLMIIVIISILAVVGVARFINLRTDAKLASVAGSVGGLRGGIRIQYGVINIKNYDTEGPVPTVTEMSNNVMNRNGGLYISPIVAGGGPGPINVFDGDGDPANVADATGVFQGEIVDLTGGWAYEPTTGQIWANTNIAGENYL